MLTVVPATRKIALDKLPAAPQIPGKKNQTQIIISFQLPMKMRIKESEGTGKSPGSRLNVAWLRLENSLSNSYFSDSSFLSISFSCPDAEDSTGLREKLVEIVLNLVRRSEWRRSRSDSKVDRRQEKFRWDKSRLLLADWTAGNGSRRQEEIDISTWSAGDYYRNPQNEKKRSDRWEETRTDCMKRVNKRGRGGRKLEGNQEGEAMAGIEELRRLRLRGPTELKRDNVGPLNFSTRRTLRVN